MQSAFVGIQEIALPKQGNGLLLKGLLRLLYRSLVSALRVQGGLFLVLGKSRIASGVKKTGCGSRFLIAGEEPQDQVAATLRRIRGRRPRGELPILECADMTALL